VIVLIARRVERRVLIPINWIWQGQRQMAGTYANN
jgi:hypothetical protein